MARQNIDEKWKTDPRRTALVERLGSARLADGMRVEINWLLLDHKGQSIPLKVCQFIKDWSAWVECGLARVADDMAYIAGADAYLEFFEKQKANASKGGKAKAAKRKPKLPKAAQTEPNCPSSSFSSSSSFSGSNSSSNSSSISSITNASDFIAAYCDRFKLRWGDFPPIQGKDAGIVGRLMKTQSLETFRLYLDAYFSMPDAYIVKAKHPLNLFELKLNEVSVFAKSGKFTTTREAHQADNMATNVQLLKDVREGKA